MAREVARSHRTMRDLIANVSHDLRTPLTSISGFAGALVDGTLSGAEGAREAGRIIGEEAERMRRLVEDLLYLGRIESGDLALQRDPIDLTELARAAQARFLFRAQECGITFNVDAPEPSRSWATRTGSGRCSTTSSRTRSSTRRRRAASTLRSVSRWSAPAAAARRARRDGRADASTTRARTFRPKRPSASSSAFTRWTRRARAARQRARAGHRARDRPGARGHDRPGELATNGYQFHHAHTRARGQRVAGARYPQMSARPTEVGAARR